jgi:hypothetical protein
MMPIYDLAEFFSLSRVLYYSLSATLEGPTYILQYITAKKPLNSEEETRILRDALVYLISAYSDKFRQLGPPAVLHPLRATALLSRTLDRLNLLDLLTQMFHDVLEDISPIDFEFEKWRLIESQLSNLLENLPSQDQTELGDRLVKLTRTEGESYFHYIARLLATSERTSILVRAKLADRLDNTLDMRIDLQDSQEPQEFFERVFNLVFVNTYRHETTLAGDHPPPAPMNGAWRLYELFKNLVLLSLIRQEKADAGDPAAGQLFQAVTTASLREAQRIFQHVLDYHGQEVRRPRQALLETMEYCYGGGTDQITRPNLKNALDGFFASYFNETTRKAREQRLNALYKDKTLMFRAAVAFTVIYQNFLIDPDYYVHGISPDGIHPL